MDISIVIPAYNEAENIPDLVHSLIETMESYSAPLTYEIILVDDGSCDSTETVVDALSHEFPQLFSIRHTTNLGQSRAFLTGFSASRGQRIITLDADLQNSPKDIPLLLNVCHLYDCVAGKRKKRHDTFWKRGISRISNRVRHLLIPDTVSDTGCSLKIFKKECAMSLPSFRGVHRFFPAYFMMAGFSIHEVEVSHSPRTRGKTKYSLFSRGISVLLDFLATAWLFHRKAPQEKIKEHHPRRRMSP